MNRLYYLLFFVIFSGISVFVLFVTVPVDLRPQIVHNFIQQVQQAKVNLTVAYWQDQRNESDLLLKLGPQMPNLPLDFLYTNMNKGRKMNDTCAKLPNLYDMHFNNYWQMYESNDGTFYMYSAFLDVREQNPLGPTVRILTMVDRHSPGKNASYCQLWFNETAEPVFSKVVAYNLIYGNTLPVVRI